MGYHEPATVMRGSPLLLILVLLLPLLMASEADAQPAPHYLILYAHSYGTSAVLNSLPQWNGEKAADISKGLAFRLSPVLGDGLRIYGAITFTLYLRASGAFFGTIGVQVGELSEEGTETPVPGARVDTSPITLRTTVLLVTVGVGIIDYQFQKGSSILLHIGVDQSSGSGTPLLVWDDPSAPTNLRLPALSPTTANISFEGQPRFGRIFQADQNGSQSIKIDAAITDAIGIYRFTNASFRLTAANGTSMSFQVALNNNTDYSSFYSITSTLSQGPWQISLSLQDNSGDTYSFNGNLWVAPFYPISIDVVGSDGTLIRNATLSVSLGSEATWDTATNASGWGDLSLPSSQVVGPMNLTITWLGTQTLFRLELVAPQTLVLRLPVYDLGVRILMYGLPIPLARVTIYQKSIVQEALTGTDGVANFKTIPSGNYTLRADYLFSTYQFPLNLQSSGVASFTVPFPHRTITLATALALIAIASVVLVRRKRGKLYPRSFDYFMELTHGGLPEACFTVIAGNSGSGKSVLLNTFAAHHLASGKSIYITNTEYPEGIRANLIKLGLQMVDAKDERLIFIDAYSAIGGGSSREEFSVASHTDLTNLGLNITKCLQIAGPGADVYLDSLNPLITTLRIDYLTNFLQSVAAKVKANNGKFCVTVSSGIEKAEITKLEESADCVIETQLLESGKGQRRRLRIKKLRGKPYVDRWTRFQVEQSKGIIFLTFSKPASPPRA